MLSHGPIAFISTVGTQEIMFIVKSSPPLRKTGLGERQNERMGDEREGEGREREKEKEKREEGYGLRRREGAGETEKDKSDTRQSVSTDLQGLPTQTTLRFRNFSHLPSSTSKAGIHQQTIDEIRDFMIQSPLSD